jgi:hypothetical protein
VALVTTTYPIPVEDLIDTLKINSVAFYPFYRQETSGTAGGKIWAKDLGDELWEADLAITNVTHAEAYAALARFNKLRGSIFSFYCYNPAMPYPQSDPDGSSLGSSAVIINTLGTDNKSLSLSGLPAGYKLSTGDFFGYDFGDPSNRALMQIVEDATADGSGVTPTFEVFPNFRVGTTTGLAINLKKPSAEMVIIPGSWPQPTSQNRMKSSFSFKAREI